MYLHGRNGLALKGPLGHHSLDIDRRQYSQPRATSELFAAATLNH